LSRKCEAVTLFSLIIPTKSTFTVSQTINKTIENYLAPKVDHVEDESQDAIPEKDEEYIEDTMHDYGHDDVTL